MDEAFVRFQDVHKAFGANHVLQGITFDILRGETMVVLGGSGSGKSVLIRHIVGLHRPDRGQVVVDGESIADYDEEQLIPIRKKVAMLFQGGALFDSMNVSENLAYGLREHTDLAEDAIRDIVRSKLALVGLEGIEELMPAELSGGMKKRVALARSIAMEPQCILYDEPTTGLDPVTSATIDELMIRMREALGSTSVVITHDMRSAYKIGSRIAMLYEGKVRQVGTVDEIRHTDDPIVRQFIEGRPTLDEVKSA